MPSGRGAARPPKAGRACPVPATGPQHARRGSRSRAGAARAKRSLDGEAGRASRGRAPQRALASEDRAVGASGRGRRPSSSTPDSHQPFSRPQPPGRHRVWTHHGAESPMHRSPLGGTRPSRYRYVESHDASHFLTGQLVRVTAAAQCGTGAVRPQTAVYPVTSWAEDFGPAYVCGGGYPRRPGCTLITASGYRDPSGVSRNSGADTPRAGRPTLSKMTG